MKTATTLMFSIIIVFSFSQENKTIKDKNSIFRIGIIAQPNIP